MLDSTIKNFPAAKYYVSPSPTPTSTITFPAKKQDSLPKDNQEAPATISSSELNQAINIYRKSHGLNPLTVNQELCTYAQKRANDMFALNKGRNFGNMILNHDVIASDVQSGAIRNYIHGKSRYGENIAAALCQRPSDNQTVKITTGVQLVEWCFDSSPLHKEELLYPSYTDVCSVGKFPFYVEIFAR